MVSRGSRPDDAGVPSVLCDVIDVVAEFMVRAWNQFHTVIHTFSVCGRNLQCQPVRPRTLERNAIGHTHARASSEQVWEPMASSSVNSCRKTCTMHVAANCANGECRLVALFIEGIAVELLMLCHTFSVST
jgi:hypothetical protein